MFYSISFFKLRQVCIRALPFAVLLACMVLNVGASCIKDSIDPPDDPFGQTTEGRDVIAYRIGDEEYVGWNKFDKLGWGYHFSSSYFLAEYYGYAHLIIKSDLAEIDIAVSAPDRLVTGRKYYVGTKIDVEGDDIPNEFEAKLIRNNDSDYAAVEGWIEFRHISDEGNGKWIFSGSFEFTAVNNEDETDVVYVTDGNFDVSS